MWAFIEIILSTASVAIPGGARTNPAPRQTPAKPSWVAFAVGLSCAAGVAGSIYAMFFQGRDPWQIAKLLLLALILAFSAMAGFALFHEGWQARSRRERAAAGRCVRCGYELRGNTSETCPECGHKFHLADTSSDDSAPARPAGSPSPLQVVTEPESGAAAPAGLTVLRFNLKEEVNRFFDDSSIPANGKPAAVIVMGGVASGKSALRKQRYPHGYVLIDAGEIFLNLSPDRGRGIPFPGPFRVPMDLVGRSVASRALSERRNLVTEIIGAEDGLVTRLVESLQSLDYAVRVEVATCGVEECLRRNATRGEDNISAYYAEPFHRDWILAACDALAKRPAG